MAERKKSEKDIQQPEDLQDGDNFEHIVESSPPPVLTKDEGDEEDRALLESAVANAEQHEAIEEDQEEKREAEEVAERAKPKGDVFRALNDTEREEDRRFGRAKMNFEALPEEAQENEDEPAVKTYYEELATYLKIMDRRAKGIRSGEHAPDQVEEEVPEDQLDGDLEDDSDREE